MRLYNLLLHLRTDSVLTIRTVLPMPRYEATGTRAGFYARVLTNVRALPGVSSAGYVSFLPLGDVRGGILPVSIDGAIQDRREKHVAFLRFVTPGYFRTLGIPFHAGRDVTDVDTLDRARVAVVSDSFVRRYWPNENPVGRHFTFIGADREVVGVVGDVRMRGLLRESEPQVYLPYNQIADREFVWYSPKDLVIRAAGDPVAVVPAVRAIVREADAQVPVSDVQTLAAIVGGETAPRATQVEIIGAFAVLALVLGGIGLHGLLSYAVSQRTQEIGVRVALGARPGDIFAMIARRSAMLLAVGGVLGIAAAYVAGRAMGALLVGIAPGDPATFSIAIGLTCAMTLAGTLVPIVRALKVDPITAIRSE